jgi:phosphatidylserine/phosphatidylglycerophosphate/cardiolipin synthase-like enzyme
VLAACAAAAVALTATSAPASGAGAHAAASTYYRLIQYPGGGFSGFYSQITHAHRTIDMEMYELADTTAEQDLAAAAARGVHVRVLLDSAFSGAEVNKSAAAYLAAHGVAVRSAPSGYIFHIKATTFDAATSDVSTANLVSKYYAGTRDAEILDTNPAQVQAIEATFANDWNAAPAGTPRSQTVQASGLVWSPNTGTGTAETALASEIAAARKTVDFESEELSDATIYGALAADAKRGVSCRIVMTNSSEWGTAFAAVTAAGCHVRVFPDSSTALYIHEKLILDDAGTASESLLIGSQNASVTSLTRNRELGVLLKRTHGGAAVIAAAGATFDSDFNNASPWRAQGAAPSSPSPSPQPNPSTAACHPLSRAGNCYEPGEDCSDADHGLTGVAGDGEAIVCEDDNGWRWEPAT